MQKPRKRKFMNYYLIDYENTGEAGLNGIDKLDENALVVIFYSVNNGRISFEMHQKLMGVKARIKYVKVALGAKNALDFQLSSYLGYLISQNRGDTFCIISRDNGYNAVIRFWEGYGIKQQYSIIRSLPAALPAPEETERELNESAAVQNIVAEAEIVPERQPEEKPERPKPRRRNTAGRKTLVKVRERNDSPEMRRLEERVRAYIEDAEIRAEVAPLIEKYKTKMGLNNAIVKIYGTEKAGEIYKKIKPLIKDKKGTDNGNAV